MPKNENAASIQSRLPALAGEKVAALLATPAPEELASVLLGAPATVELLASGVGMTLVSNVVVGLLASVAADVELLVVILEVGILPVVASAAAVARCEYDVAVQAANDVASVQVVSSVTDPDGVAVGTVA
jgi:hypothetical protein